VIATGLPGGFPWQSHVKIERPTAGAVVFIILLHLQKPVDFDVS